MQRSVLFVTTVGAMVALAAFSGEARAQRSRTVTCESVDRQPNRCRIPDGGRVRLVAQLSDTPCRANDTWGVGNGYVWVTRGCRARFDVYGGYGGYDGRGNGRDHDRDHAGWDHRGDTRAPWPGGVRTGVSLERRAESACARAASDARLAVTGYGGWTRERHGWMQTTMWVRRHGPQRSVVCTYDVRRDYATLR